MGTEQIGCLWVPKLNTRKEKGLNRELNPGPRASSEGPEARIILLDHWAVLQQLKQHHIHCNVLLSAILNPSNVQCRRVL